MGRSIISTSVDVTNAYRAMPSQTARLHINGACSWIRLNFPLPSHAWAVTPWPHGSCRPLSNFSPGPRLTLLVATHDHFYTLRCVYTCALLLLAWIVFSADRKGYIGQLFLHHSNQEYTRSIVHLIYFLSHCFSLISWSSCWPFSSLFCLVWRTLVAIKRNIPLTVNRKAMPAQTCIYI